MDAQLSALRQLACDLLDASSSSTLLLPSADEDQPSVKALTSQGLLAILRLRSTNKALVLATENVKEETSKARGSLEQARIRGNFVKYNVVRVFTLVINLDISTLRLIWLRILVPRMQDCLIDLIFFIVVVSIFSSLSIFSQADLQLQNLLFERRFYEKEIRSCQAFTSAYPDASIALSPESEFWVTADKDLVDRAKVAETSSTSGGGGDAWSVAAERSSKHVLMLCRLEHEMRLRKKVRIIYATAHCMHKYSPPVPLHPSLSIK
jgi:hypothetical protein